MSKDLENSGKSKQKHGIRRKSACKVRADNTNNKAAIPPKLMSKPHYKRVGFDVPPSEKAAIEKETKEAGLRSISEYLRVAWRIARKHPELFPEALKEEEEYQRTLPMSSWHPDARRP